MNRRLLAVVVPALVLALALSAVALWLGPVAAPAVAQGAASRLAPGMRSLTVVGQGTAYASPDVSVVNLGVEVAAGTVAEATSQNAKTMTAIMTALTNAGIPAQDITTVEYNIFVDQSGVSQGQPATYHVVNTVSVTIRKLADVTTILDDAINAGANRMYGISFSLSDPSAPETEARASAMADAQQRAQALAREIGATVGGPITISETSAYSVPFTSTGAPTAGAPAAGPITPGMLSFISSVQVTYELTGGSGLIALPTGTAAATAGTAAATAGTASPAMTATPAATGAATTAATGTRTAATAPATATRAAGATVAAVTASASVSAGTAAPLATPVAGAAASGSRYITVVGSGTVSSTPDIASVDLGVETTAADVRTAVDDNSQAMRAVLAALTGAGVAQQDIRTSNYNIFLDQSAGPAVSGAQPTPTTYRVSNTVNVTIRKLDSVGSILDAVVAAGANSIYGISFTREDWSASEAEARTQALADAQARATQLAQLAGVRLGQVIDVSEVITGGPIVSARQAATGLGGGAAPISTGQLQFSTSIQVVYSIE